MDHHFHGLFLPLAADSSALSSQPLLVKLSVSPVRRLGADLGWSQVKTLALACWSLGDLNQLVSGRSALAHQILEYTMFKQTKIVLV